MVTNLKGVLFLLASLVVIPIVILTALISNAVLFLLTGLVIMPMVILIAVIDTVVKKFFRRTIL